MGGPGTNQIKAKMAKSFDVPSRWGLPSVGCYLAIWQCWVDGYVVVGAGGMDGVGGAVKIGSGG